MATESDKNYIKRAERGSDPAEQQGDADAETKDAVDGFDMGLAGELQGGQTAGTRNDRATEYSGNKHNTEPYGADQTAGAPQHDTGHAVGITSKKLSEELGADSYVKPHTPKGNEGAFGDDLNKAEAGDLPKGKAETIETVEVSTMTPHK